jgi:hypothetical protein
LSKKLKKKIAEITGLNGLDWEARQERAAKILASTEWKQRLCNELVGLSFRELERYLEGVVSEREKKEESYERKLEAYQSGRFSKQPKPLRGDSDRRANPRPAKQPEPRTLDEILAQVYAPRVSEKWSNKDDPKLNEWLLEFKRRQPSEEVLPDPLHGDDKPEE